MDESFGRGLLQFFFKAANHARLLACGEIWRNLFISEFKLHGGQVIMGSGVRFEHPVRFMGKGTVVLGDKVVLGYRQGGAIGQPILLQPRGKGALIEIGRGTCLMNGSEVIARERISIGEDCRIGVRATIMDSDFHGIRPDGRDTPGKTSPVTVGRNVWFGNDVMVLKGVTIGNDAILAARAVVTRDVGVGEIVANDSARHVRNVLD